MGSPLVLAESSEDSAVQEQIPVLHTRDGTSSPLPAFAHSHTETHDNRRWNLFFSQLRSLNRLHQLFCVWVALYALVWPLSPRRRESLIQIVVVLSTLAEINMWLGHTWISKPGRRLPLWSPSRHVAAFYERHRTGNTLLTCLTLVLLVASLFGAVPFALAATVLLLCSLVDLWRFLYIHYWLISLFSLSLPNPRLSLALLFSALYLYAGFFKLTSRAFYEHTAPHVFRDVLCFLPRVLHTPCAAAGVAGECAMGAVLLCACAGAPVPGWLLSATVGFNVFTHAYIVVCIGLRNSIETFVSWNCFCAAMVCLLFAQHPLPQALSATASSSSSPSSSIFFQAIAPFLDAIASMDAHHHLVLLCMHVPPLLQCVGRNAYPTLSHSWFVPDVLGQSYLLLPAHAAQAALAGQDNGRALPVSYPGHPLHRRVVDGVAACVGGGYKAVAVALDLGRPGRLREPSGRVDSGNSAGQGSGGVTQGSEGGCCDGGLSGPTASRRGGGRVRGTGAEDEHAHDEDDPRDWRGLVMASTAVLDGSWVDWTLRLRTDEHDEWNECFSAGPLSFWRTVVERVVWCTCVRYVEGHSAVLCGKVPARADFIYILDQRDEM